MYVHFFVSFFKDGSFVNVERLPGQFMSEAINRRFEIIYTIVVKTVSGAVFLKHFPSSVLMAVV
jgi:hypothetical protein